ncbi:MAG: tetrahydrofolate dehydrogenase/cyclohydrolase catalytic domain-containing protein, partial [Planctomycetota bacterium]
MAAKILDGKRIADAVRATIGAKVEKFTRKQGVQPHLAAVLVGSDPASQVYIKNKRLACERAGMASSLYTPSAETTTEELVDLVARLNADPAVHGILVQLPLPKEMDERRVLHSLDPKKDVDGLHPENVGLIAEGHPRFIPCT